MNIKSIEESKFIETAEENLQKLHDIIEDLDTDYMLDIEFADGVINIELDDGRVFVINRNTAAREIWLSSPISGAGHFRPNDNSEWIDKDNRELFMTVETEIKKVLSKS